MKRSACLISLVMLVASVAVAQSHHDVTFADAMIRHHQNGIRMAQLAVDEAMKPELREMARLMVNEQRREIDVLRTLRGNAPMTPASAMMSDADMQRLEQVKDYRFDDVFIEVMARHHAAGVAMAKNHLANGTNAALREVAREIADNQTVERERLLALHRSELTSDLQPMISSSTTERERLLKN